ncbi:MAG: ATP-binding cassette domain-containing protein [Xanthomonadaceae bacterium]|nr:ATP-binding cassette domain-containing protein [Xanthomonadaceae bacterium]
MAICTELIQVGYGGHALFSASSFEVRNNTVLLGKSGCGKSTLLKTFAGLIPVISGSFSWTNKKEFGMIFQKNALFDSMTVLENVTYPLRRVKSIDDSEAKDQAIHFLRAVGLDQSLHSLPHELSGGMQKRLGIARAIAMKPEFLFVDEPTAGLDPLTTESICQLLLDSSKEKSIHLCLATNDTQVAKLLGEHFLFVDETGIKKITRDQIEHSF